MNNTLYAPPGGGYGGASSYTGYSGGGSVLPSLLPSFQSAAQQGAQEAVNALRRPMVGTVPFQPNDEGGTYSVGGMQWNAMGPQELGKSHAQALGNRGMTGFDWPESTQGKFARGGKDVAMALMGPIGLPLEIGAGLIDRQALSEIPPIANSLRGTPDWRTYYNEISDFFPGGYQGAQEPAGNDSGGGAPSVSPSYSPAQYAQAGWTDIYSPNDDGGGYDGGYSDDYGGNDNAGFGW